MDAENTNLNEEVLAEVNTQEEITPQEVENAEDLRNSYAIEGVDELITAIPKLNYMKLINLKNDMERQLEYLDSTKSLMDSLENMESVDELGKKVAISNILNDPEYKNDAAALRETYEPNKARLATILDAVKLELTKYDDIKKGTKFYTELFISNLEEAIVNLTKNSKDTTIFDNALDAFKTRGDVNRGCIPFILNYTSDMKICDIKMEVIKNPFKCIAKYENQFSTIFNKEDFEMFRSYIKEKFENSERSITTFLNDLGRIAKKEKETGKYNYVKVFVMNCIDIVKDIYDLDGGKEEFETNILKLYKKYK